MSGYPAMSVTMMMHFHERAEDGAGVGARAPSHFSDANHTEDERERHEQRSDFVCSGVKIIEHGAKMKTAILVVLLLILVVLGGIYWNQVRERDDRLKAEAAAQADRQKVEAERWSRSAETRNPPGRPPKPKGNSRSRDFELHRLESRWKIGIRVR